MSTPYLSMRSFRRFAGWLSFLSALLIGVANCEEANTRVETDYFPVVEGLAWRYRWAQYATIDSSLLMEDTVVLYADGDTLLENKSYKRIVDKTGQIDKLVRTEGDRYYGRNHELYTGFSEEYLFLDTGVPEGQSWSHIKNNGVDITEYVVEEKNATQVFNDVTYRGVIELKVNYYYVDGGERHYRFSTRHYYAPGVGEIYAYYPYPSRTYSNLNISLLPGE
jgi:hypothetical protein